MTAGADIGGADMCAGRDPGTGLAEAMDPLLATDVTGAVFVDSGSGSVGAGEEVTGMFGDGVILGW